MSAVCPKCGVAVVPGYVKCPKCQAALSAGSTSRRSGGAGGTAVAGGGGSAVLPFAIGGAVAIGIVLFFALRKDSSAAAPPPEEDPAGEQTPVATPTQPDPTALPPDPTPTAGSDKPDPTRAINALSRALTMQRLWGKVEIVGDHIDVRSGACSDPGMVPVLDAHAPPLREAGLTKVRCLEQSGAVVFEHDL